MSNFNILIEGNNVLNLSLQQNAISVLKKIKIENRTLKNYQELTLEISSDPIFCEKIQFKIESIKMGQEIIMEDLKIAYSPSFLFDLSEKIRGFFKIILYDNKEVLHSITHSIEIFPLDYWTGVSIVPELLASFITPNHYLVAEVVKKASKILQTWCGDPSFVGYTENNINEVNRQIASIYEALKQQDITYSLSHPSFEQIGQRIRLIPSIFQEKLANCLDLTLLFASIIEYIGLNPIIVILKGHALLGVWLEDEIFLETIQDDLQILKKRVQKGINKILLVETTLITNQDQISFEKCIELANTQIENESNFDFLIDVKRARFLNFTPIPLQREKLLSNEVEDIHLNQSKAPQTLKKIDVSEKKKDISRLDLWERKLLDLSLRNTLLAFRENNNNIRLICKSVELLENKLSSMEEFKLLPILKEYSKDLEKEQKIQVYDHLIEKELENKNVFTSLDENILDEKVLHLYRQAKISIEENGANSLYLAIGFLRWYETEKSDKKRLSPLILLPIEIVKKNSRGGYVFRLREEEPRFNITLLEMLRVKFNLNITGLDPLPEDDHGIDILKIFTILRNAILTYKNWEVEELSYIGLFSFTQFIMWNDLKNRTEDLKRNKIVDSLIKGYRTFEIIPKAEENIQTYNPIDYALPISSDSSQLAAIIESTKNSSFILHGPPGTGKSQTITNIIANALYHKKKVLFVAEKMNALTVVQNKLQKIGLDPFILELHSNKTNKKEVLSHLDKTLKLGKLKKPAEFTKCADELYFKRNELNEITKQIHQKSKYGFSLFESISKYEKYKSFLNLDLDAKLFTKEFNEKNALKWIDEYLVSLDLIDDVRNHPLKGLNLLKFDGKIKSEMEAFILNFIQIIESLLKEQEKFCDELGIENDLNFKEISALFNLAKILSRKIIISPAVFDYNHLSSVQNEVLEALKNGQSKEKIKTELSHTFSVNILEGGYSELEKDFNSLKDLPLFKRMLKKQKITKQFKKFVCDKKMFSKKKIGQYLQSIKDYHAMNLIVLRNDDLLTEIFQNSYNHLNAVDYFKLETEYLTALEINQEISYLKQKCDIDSFIKKILNTPSIQINFLRSIEIFEEQLDLFIQRYQFDLREVGSYRDFLGDFMLKLENIIKHLSELRDFIQYNQVRDQLFTKNLRNLIEAYENKTIEKNDLKSVFLKNIYRVFTEKLIEENESLKNFNGIFYNKKIEDYKNLIEEYQNLTIQELIHRLSSRIPIIESAAQTSEIGILNKAIRSNGRGISIRSLMDTIPNLLTDLTPCMLMSPISVAQYIDPKFPEFDLVIFDEASQIPTSEAIGAISRGKNLIVVGDPKQLPPTSFFNTVNIDMENLEKEDLESILDDCLTLQMREYHLKWHYRSKHESLISFSNKSFYESSLMTFPSPNDLESKVNFVYVKGTYDKSKTKQNLEEGKAVVDEIEKRVMDDELINYSIGVVTFNIFQQHLIEELLNKRLATNRVFEERYLSLKETIFIKNLENVQGDERDVIIFSIGYGPDSNHKITLNFGPLNRDGGYRRLNVAVSRAKHEMIIFSSLSPEDIDLNRTNASGLKYLKAFLEYAKNRSTLDKIYFEEIKAEKDFLKQEIQVRLREKGIQTNLNVGTSNYKIDLGIINPKNPNEYILGILLDDYDLESNLNIKDIFVNETNVLQQLGWKLHRLWALDWYTNSEREVAKILESMEKPLQKIKEKNVEVQYKKEKIKDEVEYYVSLTIPKFRGSYIELSDLQSPKIYPRIEDQIRKVIEREQPIHKIYLYRRLQEAWNQPSLTLALKKFFDSILHRNNYKIKKINEEEFIFSSDFDIQNYHFFRIPKSIEERREFKEIEELEIQAAILYLLKKQYGMNRQDLNKEMSKLFGFTRITPTNVDVLERNVELLLKSGKIQSQNNFLTIPNLG